MRYPLNRFRLPLPAMDSPAEVRRKTRPSTSYSIAHPVSTASLPMPIKLWQGNDHPGGTKPRCRTAARSVETFWPSPAQRKLEIVPINCTSGRTDKRQSRNPTILGRVILSFSPVASEAYKLLALIQQLTHCFQASGFSIDADQRFRAGKAD
jgi:hypothetical protein